MDQEQNLDALVELGFHVCPWEVTYHAFKGSKQLEKEDSPFNFHVGQDWVVGQYFFDQPLGELKLIEDDIILLMFNNGLPFPEIDRDTGPEGIMYVVGIRGQDSREIYEQLGKVEKVIQDELARIPASQELAESNFMIVAGRFGRRMSEVLTPIGDLDTYPERHDMRKEERKTRLIGQMSLLIKAVREGAGVKYGTIIERIKSLSPLDYDPHNAIQNILSGKYNDASSSE